MEIHDGTFCLILLFSFKPFLLFRDLCFYSFNHLGEFDFALLFRFGVDVEFLALAAGEPWEEAAFPEVVVDLIQASCAGFTHLSRDRLGMGLCGRTRGVYGRFHRLLGCLLCHGHLCVCAADFAVNAHRRLHLHGVGHVAINIKCGRR